MRAFRFSFFVVQDVAPLSCKLNCERATYCTVTDCLLAAGSNHVDVSVVYEGRLYDGDELEDDEEAALRLGIDSMICSTFFRSWAS